MQEWLRQQCGGSAFDKGCFQDLRQQLARLVVQMCDCWSQVHVDGDVETRWRILYPLLCEEVSPSDTLAASVETCCGCAGSLRRDADAGGFGGQEVDFAQSSDQEEEVRFVHSQGQPSPPGLPPSLGLARASGVQREALPRVGDAGVWSEGGTVKLCLAAKLRPEGSEARIGVFVRRHGAVPQAPSAGIPYQTCGEATTSDTPGERHCLKA